MSNELPKAVMCSHCGNKHGTDHVLRWVYEQTREALFTKGNGKAASAKRDAVLSEINKQLKAFE